MSLRIPNCEIIHTLDIRQVQKFISVKVHSDIAVCTYPQSTRIINSLKYLSNSCNEPIDHVVLVYTLVKQLKVCLHSNLFEIACEGTFKQTDKIIDSL